MPTSTTTPLQQPTLPDPLTIASKTNIPINQLPRSSSSTSSSTSKSTSTLHHRPPTKSQPSKSQQQLNRTDPLIKILEPLPHRILYFLTIWLLKLLGTIYLQYQDLTNPQPESSNPDLIKRYPCRPALPVRIFFPPDLRTPQHLDTKADEATNPKPKGNRKVPLYVNIHGGGFVLGSAKLDDTFCRNWALRTNSIVASLNYGKAPLSPFPVSTHDVAALTASILDDNDLPVDASRVVTGGFSAGALLALSASQVPQLRDRIHAVVAYYPAVDFSEYPAAKFARRIDTTRERELLFTFGGALDWAYVSTGLNRRDKVLSPCYATNADLPARICIVGAQYDMFCREGRDMIFELAGREIEDEEWMEGFEDGNYKWVFARGMAHGFTEGVGRGLGRAGRREEYCERLFEEVHLWLRKGGL